MIATTEALVLRVAPFSRTSHIVTWLTPRQGQLATVIKGAMRPKSPFLGQYDLFYTCELVYYEKERNGLHVARECSPLAVRRRFRTDWRAMAAASYICDMLARVSISGGHETELYSLALETLDELTQRGPDITLLLWFELALASTLGLAPQLRTCLACGCAISVDAQPRFAPVQGGLFCSRCGRHHGRDDMLVAPDILAILRRWQDTERARAALRTRCSAEQLIALRLFLAVFLVNHVDVSLRSRQLAIEMIIA